MAIKAVLSLCTFTGGNDQQHQDSPRHSTVPGKVAEGAVCRHLKNTAGAVSTLEEMDVGSKSAGQKLSLIFKKNHIFLLKLMFTK